MDLIDPYMNNKIWFFPSPKDPAEALKPIVDNHGCQEWVRGHSFLERYASLDYGLELTDLEIEGFE